MVAVETLANAPALKQSVEQRSIVVSQPEKLGSLLETIDLLAKVSERIGEDISGDMGGGNTGSKQGDDDDTAVSIRDQAIAALPNPKAMQSQLLLHMQQDIKAMRKQVKKQALKTSKPGSAYELNEYYAKIRRINSFVSAIAQASSDLIKRIYIKLFIDKQSVYN